MPKSQETKNLSGTRNRGRVKKIIFSMLNRLKVLFNMVGLIYLFVSIDTHAEWKDAIYEIEAYSTKEPGEGPAHEEISNFHIPTQTRHELVRVDCIETTNNGTNNGHHCSYDADSKTVTVKVWAGSHQKAFRFFGWRGPRAWRGAKARIQCKIWENDPEKNLVILPSLEEIQKEADAKAKKAASKACEQKLKKVENYFLAELEKEKQLLGLELDNHKKIIHALCFPGETLICVPLSPEQPVDSIESLSFTQEYNQVPIDSLKLGDSVICWNFETQTPVTGVIQQLHQSTVSRLIKLRISGRVLRATEDHPFYLKSKGSWVKAQELRKGDELLKVTGETVKVEDIGEESGSFQVFNIEVLEYHNYFAEEVLVHNCDELGVPVPPKLIREESEELATPSSNLTNEERIKASFRLHLGREPSDREVQKFLGEIVKGRSIVAIELDIAHLSEALVRSIYIKHLKRIPKPDETGFKDWVTFLDEGGDIRVVEKTLGGRSSRSQTNLI